MKRACWASPLGDCNGPLERAHLISNALWDGDTVGVYDWTMDAPEERGRGALTAKIQCAHHNRELSPVDAEGGGLFKDLRRIQQWVTEEGAGAIRDPAHFDGWLIERWFIATTINKVVRHDLAPWHDGSPAHEPPLELIESVFGKNVLPYPMGLWSCEGFDKRATYGGVGIIRSAAQWGPRDEVLGYMYDFAFFRLLAWMAPTLPPEHLAQSYRQQFHAFKGPMGQAGLRIDFGDVPGDVDVTEWTCQPRQERSADDQDA